MLIGYSSVQRKGYDVKELIDTIGDIIDSPESLNIAIIGIGNLEGPWPDISRVRGRSEPCGIF